MPKREQRTEGEPVTTVIRDKNSLRCDCGNLLASVVPGGVELKCRRCKRQVMIPLDRAAATSQTNALNPNVPA